MTAGQLARIRDVDPRVLVEGEPGGVAIVPLPEAARETLEDPEERPDLDVAALLARAEVLLASRVPADLPARAPRLTWIQVTSAGVDHLWQPFLDESEVVLTSACSARTCTDTWRAALFAIS